MLRHRSIYAAAAAVLLFAVAGCKSTSSSRPSQAQPVPAAEPPWTLGKPLAPQPPPSPASADNLASNILAWDSVVKEHKFQWGDTNAAFTFTFTNVSPEHLLIFDTSTTCDCTVAPMPGKPWSVGPGAVGQITASIDMRQDKWLPVNYIVVFTSKGNRMLTVKVLLPKSVQPAADAPSASGTSKPEGGGSFGG